MIKNVYFVYILFSVTTYLQGVSFVSEKVNQCTIIYMIDESTGRNVVDCTDVLVKEGEKNFILKLPESLLGLAKIEIRKTKTVPVLFFLRSIGEALRHREILLDGRSIAA